jgi:hypothetical protein
VVSDEHAEWSYRIEYILKSKQTGRNNVKEYEGLPNKLVICRPSR